MGIPAEKLIQDSHTPDSITERNHLFSLTLMLVSLLSLVEGGRSGRLMTGRDLKNLGRLARHRFAHGGNNHGVEVISPEEPKKVSRGPKLFRNRLQKNADSTPLIPSSVIRTPNGAWTKPLIVGSKIGQPNLTWYKRKE